MDITEIILVINSSIGYKTQKAPKRQTLLCNIITSKTDDYSSCIHLFSGVETVSIATPYHYPHDIFSFEALIHGVKRSFLNISLLDILVINLKSNKILAKSCIGFFNTRTQIVRLKFSSIYSIRISESG